MKMHINYIFLDSCINVALNFFIHIFRLCNIFNQNRSLLISKKNDIAYFLHIHDKNLHIL